MPQTAPKTPKPRKRNGPRKPRNYDDLIAKYGTGRTPDNNNSNSNPAHTDNHPPVNLASLENADNSSDVDQSELEDDRFLQSNITNPLIENAFSEFEVDHRQIQAILVLIDSDSWGLTLAQKAERAKLPVATMRRYLNDAAFQSALRQVISARALETTPETLEAAIESAKIRGKGGHADRKMLLSMVGVSTDRKTVAVEHDVSGRLERALSQREAALAGLATDDGPQFVNPEGDGGVVDLGPEDFEFKGPDDGD